MPSYRSSSQPLLALSCSCSEYFPPFQDECSGDKCSPMGNPTLGPSPIPTSSPAPTHSVAPHPSPTSTEGYVYKPVLYLYPQEERQLTVTLDVAGELETVYPAPGSQVQTDRGDPGLVDSGRRARRHAD